MVLNNYTKPPIKAGITNKKNHDKCMSSNNMNYIIDDFQIKIWFPGNVSCNLISKLKEVPTKPANKAKLRYNIPISLVIGGK